MTLYSSQDKKKFFRPLEPGLGSASLHCVHPPLSVSWPLHASPVTPRTFTHAVPQSGCPFPPLPSLPQPHLTCPLRGLLMPRSQMKQDPLLDDVTMQYTFHCCIFNKCTFIWASIRLSSVSLTGWEVLRGRAGRRRPASGFAHSCLLRASSRALSHTL